MNKNIENQIVNKIYGHGRGWCFSQKDFAAIAKAETINRSLARLRERGTIRRISRGLYDYPGYSKLLNQVMPPNIDQAAHALARQFGWNIEITSSSALNLLGLSTQVPTQYVYLSDGPAREYDISGQQLTFKSVRPSHMGLKIPESQILVQAIHGLGNKPLNENETQAITKYLLANGLNTQRAKQIEKDTQYVTSWVYQNIKDILKPAVEKAHSLEQ